MFVDVEMDVFDVCVCFDFEQVIVVENWVIRSVEFAVVVCEFFVCLHGFPFVHGLCV